MPLSFLLQTVSGLCVRECVDASLFKDTHYAIARYAIEHGLHVLVTKPATKLLEHHLDLIDLSRVHNVVCFVEHHKRFVLLHHELFPLYMTTLYLDMTLSTAMRGSVREHLASSTSSMHG
jgi:hypothetical protein